MDPPRLAHADLSAFPARRQAGDPRNSEPTLGADHGQQCNRYSAYSAYSAQAITVSAGCRAGLHHLGASAQPAGPVPEPGFQRPPMGGRALRSQAHALVRAIGLRVETPADFDRRGTESDPPRRHGTTRTEAGSIRGPCPPPPRGSVVCTRAKEHRWLSNSIFSTA